MKPTIPEVWPLVKAYRDAGNHVGGSLHIVLDEGNVTDNDVRWCIRYARRFGDEAGAKLGEILLAMSKTQRSKLSNMFYDGT